MLLKVCSFKHFLTTENQLIIKEQRTVSSELDTNRYKTFQTHVSKLFYGKIISVY